MAKPKKSATYVDGYVLTVPTKDMTAYKRMATLAKKIWLEHGAVDYHESVLEDATSEWGMTFTDLTKAKRSETIVFAWVTYKTKADRKRVNAKVMQDPRLGMDIPEMEKVMKRIRMTYGGFKIIV